MRYSRVGLPAVLAALMALLGAGTDVPESTPSAVQLYASLGLTLGPHGELRATEPTVALGLFDPDPLPDVALYRDGQVQVFRNRGNGSFGSRPVYSEPFSGGVRSLRWQKTRKIGQWVSDHTSWGDLVIERDDHSTETIPHGRMIPHDEETGSLWRQTTPTSFQFHEVWRSPLNNAPSSQFALGDVDKDGRMEVSYCFYPPFDSVNLKTHFVVYENTGPGSYVVEWDTMAMIYGPYSMSDIDQDGHNEWVVLGASMKFLECYGPRSYRSYRSNISFEYPSRPGQNIFKAFQTDVDHDGILELSVLNSDPSIGYDNTLIFLCEFVTKNYPGVMGFNQEVARGDFYCFDMAIGQVDGEGIDEIVPGAGDFGYGEPVPISYLWYSGTPDVFAWKLRGIETGLFSGSTAPMFVDLDGDSKVEDYIRVCCA